MKRTILGLAVAAVMAVAGLGAAGCGDPCTKAFTKWEKCSEKKIKPKKKKKEIAECKKDEDAKKRMKKCAGISKCSKFMDCLKGRD
jgi:hypothetical protein